SITSRTTLFPYTTLYRSGEFQIRYNNFKDVMEYEQKPGEYLELIKDQNYIVAFRNGETYHYKKYNDNKGNPVNGYLLVVGTDDKDRKSTRLNSSHVIISY